MADSKPSPYLGNKSKFKVLVVGAGGIGCEVLKNLVLTGFKEIDIVDLDTIDLSNLNRQFLFRNEHIGKSKAEVAKETILQFCPSANINAFHNSISSSKFGREYFKQFAVVISALDNIPARSHVNRMCLAANVPLVNPGTAGYIGQVEVILKGISECFECKPMKEGGTFPMCTIRNNPTRFIHCIVWAKHLFNQLFGEQDSSDNVDDSGSGELRLMDVDALFQKLFHDEILKLVNSRSKDEKGIPPVPLQKKSVIGLDLLATTLEKMTMEEDVSLGQLDNLEAQTIWTLEKNVLIFDETFKILKKSDMNLTWDKDDKNALDLVTAASNIRAHIFHLGTKSRFDIKSMAGNIVPAIATTNAIIAGQTVIEVIKIVSGKSDNCKNVFWRKNAKNAKNRKLVPIKLGTPNPACLACSEKKEVSITLNSMLMTLESFREKILKKSLQLIQPDMIDMSNGSILLSADDADIDIMDILSKKMEELVNEDAILIVSDDLQDLEITLYLVNDNKLDAETFIRK